MKFTAFIVLITILQVKAATTSAQSVTLNENKSRLSDVIKKIRLQVGYDYIYNEDLINQYNEVSVHLKNATLAEALQQTFNHLPLTYSIENNIVVIKQKSQPSVKPSNNENVRKEFEGKVIDIDSKQPLVAVTISIAAGKAIAQTNSSGSFKLTVDQGTTLTFTLVGYKPKQVIVKDSNAPMVISLEPLVNEMKDVVVTGIFNRKSESFTGSTSKISGEDIKKISSSSIFTAISAIDPSFRMVANNASGANLNQLPQIQMRGENSFPNLSGELSNNPNEPLFILDGFQVPLQRVVDLDMNLIQNITLLKDASATSIYGSRGANGVMVITTIPPAEGKIQITYTHDFRINTPQLSVYNLLNAAEKLDFEKRVGIYESTIPIQQYGLDLVYSERNKSVLKGINTDWLKIPTQIGYSNRSSIRLQGGDHTLKYGLQFSADLQQGVMKSQDRDNYSGQIDLSYTTNKIRFMNSLRVYSNKANSSPYGSFSQYVAANPYYSPYDQDGNVQYYMEDIPFHSSYQPYRAINPMYNTTLHSINSTGYFGVTNNLSLRYNVLPFLFFESNLSITKQTNDATQFYSAQDTRFASYTEVSRKGLYSATDGNEFNYENVTTANLNLRQGKSQFFSTLGLNFGSDKSDYYTIVAEGFPYDKLDNLLFANQYQTNGKPTGDESEARRIGYLYNGNYSYDNKYLADFSIRRDGSSQYGSDKRFGTFWSTGIGWNMHNENFLKSYEWMNRLKLRATYGSTGSLNIPAYSALSRYAFGVNSSYYNELGATTDILGNTNLSWQNVYKLNVGLDASLFNQRLEFRVDLYKENTKNALAQVTLAPSSGYVDFPENLGELENKGVEFSAKYVIINKKAEGILWSVNVNGFSNSNILKKLSNKLRSVNDELNEKNLNQVYPNMLLVEGQSINTIYAVRSLGIDPITGSEIFLDKNGKQTFLWNAADKVAVGVNQPKWNGNFGSNLYYKGFEAGLIFNYQYGGQLYNQTLVNRVENVDPSQNVDRRAYSLGWQHPGDVSQYKRIQSTVITTNSTSRFVQDDNNLKLTAASMGYNFIGKQFLKKVGLNSLGITASANDVIWLSSIQVERGTDNPFARTYSLSIRAGF
ncbi:SusC/RagA family TonB-linked outer membrane protein [Pedobacter sp.]|uniref:SusC/RagA family TonB-linked outer membrane protein n=1 Tax=Pedobacter sp. TaxID=1411316 RepID=UPI003D7FC576